MELIASRHHLMKFMRLGVFKLCVGNKTFHIYSRRRILLQAKDRGYNLKAKSQKTEYTLQAYNPLNHEYATVHCIIRSHKQMYLWNLSLY